MYEEKKKSFLEELQLLDESTKRKILIVASIVILAVVIYVWLGYFNSIVVGVPQAPIADDQSAQAQTVPAQNISAGPGALQDIASGMASIGKIFEDALGGVVNFFEGGGQYNITPHN